MKKAQIGHIQTYIHNRYKLNPINNKNLKVEKLTDISQKRNDFQRLLIT